MEVIEECERKFEDYHSRIQRQQEKIRGKRHEAITLQKNTDLIRMEANTVHMKGTIEVKNTACYRETYP